MKKSLILLSICSAVLLTSCGTSSYYASSAFEDGIYYRPSKDVRAENEADAAQVRGLIERTRQEAARFSDTILISGAAGTVDIPYVPETQYTIMFDRPLDSINEVNLNFNFDDWYPGYGYRGYYSYWDWRYWNVFGPSWYRWGWHSPWYGWGWYDPWYCGWSWGFGFAWDPWYGPWGGWYAGWYGPGWYDPWYWGYPVASFYPAYAYYGKRNVGVRTGSGVTGGRTMAMGKGISLRSGGRTQSAAPAMSAVRGRTASRSSSANSTVSTPMGGGRTAAGRFHASGNSVNLGERYVSRGSLSATASPSRQTAAGGRTAYSNGGTFRRPAAAGNTSYRRPSGVSAEGFRSPFESRSQSYSRSSFNTGRNTAGYNRSTAVNSSRSSFNRSYNSSSRSSYSTGSYSRSSMSGGRSYGGGGSVRGGGGGRR